MFTARAFIPRPRRSGLVSQELDGELLLYVEATHQASSLNSSASRIWTLCDGERPVDVICAMAGLWPDVVVAALRQFAEAGLLENGSEVPSVNLSRRRMLGRVSLAAPVILLIIAPAAEACVSRGPCTIGQTCCSNGQSCSTNGGICPP
jgi:hypothetical protein